MSGLSFKNYFCLFVLLFNLGCEYKDPVNKGILYEIYCKHPAGKIYKFKVNYENWSKPYAWQSGIWHFTSNKGVVVKATNCYTDNIVRKSNVKSN